MIAACNHCLAMVGTRNNSKMRIARCMQCSGRTPYDVGSSVLLLYGSRRLAKIAQFFGGSPVLPSYDGGQPSWTLFWDQIVFAQARRDRKSPEMEAVWLGGSALVGLLELHRHRSSHFWADHAILKVSAHLCCACTCRKVGRANDMLQGTKS